MSINEEQIDKGKKLTSRVPYREAFQRGASSRDDEIELLQLENKALKNRVERLERAMDIDIVEYVSNELDSVETDNIRACSFLAGAVKQARAIKSKLLSQHNTDKENGHG